MNRAVSGLWRARLLALNLILPILEIEACGEALRLIGGELSAKKYQTKKEP